MDLVFKFTYSFYPSMYDVVFTSHHNKADNPLCDFAALCQLFPQVFHLLWIDSNSSQFKGHSVRT